MKKKIIVRVKSEGSDGSRESMVCIGFVFILSGALLALLLLARIHDNSLLRREKQIT